jgi:RNA polymerase sigma-70 factor (ECF subfamily)
MVKKTLPTNAMLESDDDFEAAYKTHERGIYRFLFWRTSNKELSEDLTSSVFTKAWQSRKSYHGGSIQAWLYTIARNSLADYWRKKKEVVSDEVDTYANDNPSAEEVMEAKLDHERLKVAIAKLSPQMHEIIEKRFIKGLSTREVAEQLDISEGNVRIIQYRALKQLRKHLS